MRNFTGNKRYERTKDFSKRRGNDYARPMMHEATCDSCGKACEVPFKPTSGKPIFCSSCFEKGQNDNSKKFDHDRGDRRDRNDRSDRTFRSGDSRKRSFDDRDTVMHHATCDSCGSDCEVPFRPTKGKPIYCDNCFENNKGKDTDQSKEEFEKLNEKLDRILEMLMPLISEKNYQEELEEESVELILQKKPKKKMVLKKEVKE
jgi:CxxC-x17-CxxC domain-containing protein